MFSRALGLAAVSAGTVAFISSQPSSFSSSDVPHAPHQHWNHKGFFSALDTAAVRRGFEVYRNVCSTCHSLKYRSYRQLVGVSHTEVQTKALAASITVRDGPNDEGEFFDRDGKLFDFLPKPYPNEQAARFANGGASPPDLSLMVTARHAEEDYIFAILTGYHETPAGFALRDGLYYNTYFSGNAISMKQPLMDGQVEFEDGTPATISQMAKDVSVFLSWSASPEQDKRKQMGAKALISAGLLAALTAIMKRRFWSLIKTKKVTYTQGF